MPWRKETKHRRLVSSLRIGRDARKCLKQKATGSSPPSWPFSVDVHRFLGSLPVNDRSLMEEAGIGSSPASSSPSAEVLTSGMVTGLSSRDDIKVDTPEEGVSTQAPAPEQASSHEDCFIRHRNGASGSSDGARRKQKKCTGAEIKEMCNEQRLLREQFEAAH